MVIHKYLSTVLQACLSNYIKSWVMWDALLYGRYPLNIQRLLTCVDRFSNGIGVCLIPSITEIVVLTFLLDWSQCTMLKNSSPPAACWIRHLPTSARVSRLHADSRERLSPGCERNGETSSPLIAIRNWSLIPRITGKRTGLSTRH